jgi:protein phosphatase 1 regulatory subunit 37
VKKSRGLRFLDLAQNYLDKKSIEFIVAALETPPEQGLESLRLDDCSLRPAALEILCESISSHSLSSPFDVIRRPCRTHIFPETHFPAP